MQLPVKAEPTGIGQRPDWMPDPGVFRYVQDLLEKKLGIETDYLPEHWIPLGIVGTLDWVMICGWWVYRNVGLFQSDEPYKWVFDYDGYEFDPDQLLMFLQDAERNKFETRFARPGIDGKERTEALQFLLQDVYARWAKTEWAASSRRADELLPPQGFAEAVMWATFLWVMSDYGKDWMYSKDEVFACVFEYGVAYQCRWDNQLLDPQSMRKTERKTGTCRFCGNLLWCVRGAAVGDVWQFACVNCLNVEAISHAEDETYAALLEDNRVISPPCPHRPGRAGEKGNCMATCPHSKMSEERVWQMAEKKGSERLERYRETMRMHGGSPRELAGQTVDSIVNHFKES